MAVSRATSGRATAPAPTTLSPPATTAAPAPAATPTTATGTTATGTTATGAPPVSTGPTTAGPTARPTAGFVVIGDSGTGSPEQFAVASRIGEWAADHRVDALVAAGDNVYPDGSPDRFAEVLDRPYGVLGERPRWVTLGNHDVDGGHGAEQLRHLGLPDLPYVQSLAGVQFLFLDANRPDDAQARWLDAALGAPGPSLRIVVFHQPAWSCSLHGSTAAVDERWVPVLERHRVALVLNGHDHVYERFTSPAGVTYVVTGGGGAPLYDLAEPCTVAGARTDVALPRHEFLAVEVFGATAQLTAIADDGTVLDRATVPAG